MRILPCATALVLASIVSFAPILAQTQAKRQSARELVQSIVDHEVSVDANDHSHWMYRDANKVHGSSTVKLVVETSSGDLSKTLSMDGHPLTDQQRQADQQRMHTFVTEPAVRQKQKKNHEHDDRQAAALTKMLPDAFLWKVIATNGDDTTLAFKPDPKFSPPTRPARVFAAMEGTMVVNTNQKRIQSLKGTLIHEVDFGWFSILGKLYKGGTFNVERRDIGNGVWEITATHIHIHGHALIFKSITEDQDEETSNYKPSPSGITLAEAGKMLNDGTVAKKLGVESQ